MTLDLAPRFSERVDRLHSSPIRDILAVISRPGMISFAGGLPAAETFPEMTLGSVPRSSLQYGASEGDPDLRRQVAAELQSLGVACTQEQVLILSGSQQGIDLVAKLFVDRGTTVAVESPTYLAALQVFRLFGARFTTIEPGHASASLAHADAPALAYVIPTFQNPTGYCYAQAERVALAAACDEHAVPLFEDDPYRDLAYDACDRRPVCAYVRQAPWIYQGSFSKSLAPGLRLGYLAASPDLFTPLARLKQAADLHSNRVSQWYVLQQLQHSDRARRIEQVVATYRRKRDHFADRLGEHFAGLARWETPAGGLFFWVQLSRRIDTRGLLPAAIAQNVAFMPGESFYADATPPRGALRLNFSHASEEQVDEGLATLSRLIRHA